ncbi:MAG: hypothetical protein M3Z02_12265 [Actinomycetota bacterium]|nr:hypothetical protein [Actinomycetota bacterium]
MSVSRRTAVMVAAWAGAGLLGAAVVTGVASAASTSPSPTGPAAGAPVGPAPGPAAGGHRAAGGLGRVLHGQYVVQTKDGVRTMSVQRGEVTAVNDTAITITSTDGVSGTYLLTADTKIRKDGAVVAVGTLKRGEQAGVVALDADGKKTARAVTEHTPGVRPAHPGGGRGAQKPPAGSAGGAGVQAGSFDEDALAG